MPGQALTAPPRQSNHEQTVFSDTPIFTPETPSRQNSSSPTCKAYLTPFPKTTERPCLHRKPPPDTIRHAKKPSESRTDISNLYFQKATEYIRNNYAYPIQISDVAHYVGIDRSYLYRIFMEHENTSPKQYLLKHRLQMATQLLCSSSCTITEAALSCGFRDAPSFCNYFRQGTGYTPKEFRKAYSGTIYT